MAGAWQDRGIDKPVLCVRNDPFDDLGLVPQALIDDGLAVQTIDAFDLRGEWPGIDDLAGLVVFGGEMNVDETERYPGLLRLRALLDHAVQDGLPTMGICLGAQALARALGAPVSPAPVRELGFVPITMTPAGASDALLSAFSTGSHVFEWHEDTFTVPAAAVLLATGTQVRAQAFRAGPHAWGIQFHLEVTDDGINEWLRQAGPGLADKWGRSAESIVAQTRRYLPAQQERAREVFHRFADCIRSHWSSE